MLCYAITGVTQRHRTATTTQLNKMYYNNEYMALKPKSKQVLDIIASEPKTSATEAYLRVHNTENRATAAANAYQLMQKPQAQIYLEKHIDKARTTMVTLLDAEKDDIKLRAATDILDRTQGKAVQTTEVRGTVLTLNIDLTQSDTTQLD